jgi:hypothetical protein
VGLVPLASNTDARLVAGLLRQPLAGPVGVTVPRRARNSNRQERPLLSIPFHTSGAPEGRRARGITPCEGPARRICRRWRRYGRGQEARVRVRDRDRRSRRCGGGSLVDGVASALRAAEAGRPGSVASVEPGSVHSQRCEAGIRGGGAGNSRCRAMERQRALRRALRERWSRGAPRRRCSRPGEALGGLPQAKGPDGELTAVYASSEPEAGGSGAGSGVSRALRPAGPSLTASMIDGMFR